MRLEAKKLGQQLEKTWAVGTPEFKKASGELEKLNRTIRNADKSAGNFKSNIGNYAGSVGDAFQGMGVNVGSFASSLGSVAMATGPVGVGLAALTGAASLFGGAIKSSDTLTDKLNETLGAAKEAANTFFRALATGDFSNFLTNIRAAIDEGQRYARTLDQIGDRQRAIQILESGDRERLAQLQIIRRDATKSIEERIKASAEIISIELENAKKRKELAQDELKNELENASKRTGLTQKRIEELLILNETNKKVVDAAKDYNDAVAILAEQSIKNPLLQVFSDKTKTENAKKVIESTSQEVKVLAGEYRKLGNLAEESYIKIADSFQKVGDENASFYERTARTQVQLSKLKKGVLDTDEQLNESLNKTAKIITSISDPFDAHIEQWKALNEQLRRAVSLQDDFGLYARVLKPKGGETAGVGGLRTGAGTANLPPAPGALEGFNLQATTDAAVQFANIWGDAYNQREQALSQSLEKGLISEKKYQSETEKLQKKQANLQRIATIAQLTGDMARTLGALGVGAANTAKVGFPLNIPLLVAFAAQAAGIIANLRSIKFEHGGMMTVGGNPHSQGGTKFVGSDGSAFEAERDEVLAIVNKHDSRTLRSLSDLNSRNGRAFYQPMGNYFASGGLFMPNTNIGNGNSDQLIRSIVAQIGAIPVQVSLNEIEKKSNEKRKVDVIGSL